METDAELRNPVLVQLVKPSRLGNGSANPERDDEQQIHAGRRQCNPPRCLNPLAGQQQRNQATDQGNENEQEQGHISLPYQRIKSTTANSTMTPAATPVTYQRTRPF